MVADLIPSEDLPPGSWTAGHLLAVIPEEALVLSFSSHQGSDLIMGALPP